MKQINVDYKDLTWSETSGTFPINDCEGIEELDKVRDEWIEKLKILRCGNRE